MTDVKLEEFQTAEVLENKIVEARSAPNMGIKLEGETFWRNFSSKASDKDKEDIRTRLAKLPFGSKININTLGERIFTDFKVVSEPENKAGTFGKDREIVELKTLLDAAHKVGLKTITTDVREISYVEGKEMVHFKATVWAKDGGRFEGSACKHKADMTPQQQKYWLEIVESQAIARALRWFTNTGDVSDVEVNGEEGTKPKEPTEREE